MDQPLLISSLQKGREKRSIIVRVVRKWTMAENRGQGQPMYVGMVFADAQGGAIYAEIPLQFISLKENLFQIGEIHQVKKFKVRANKQNFRVVPGPLMVEISEQTTVESVVDPPRTIPERVYNLTDLSAVVPSDGPLVQYTDVIGYLIKYTDLDTFVPKNKENVIMLRELHIKDLRQNVMKVTIWGDQATNFSIDHVYDEKVGNIVVCLILGCTPKREFNDYNKIYLSASQTYCCYLNPQIPEAADYYARFRNTPVFIERPTITEEPKLPPAQKKELEMKTIAELNAISDPYEFEDGSYKCTVTITSAVQPGKWWYMACKPCRKKALQQPDGSYKCPKCNGRNTASRYLLTFWGRDDTAEGRFFAHDNEAKIIIGKECDAIMSPLGLTGGVPQQILNIVGKKYVFSVDLDDDDTLKQYVVKAVLMKPARRPMQATLPASSTNTQALLTEHNIAEEIGTSSSRHNIDKDNDQRLQVPQDQQTPPPPDTPLTPKATGTSAQSEKANESSNARRNLNFEEDVDKDKELSNENATLSDDEPTHAVAAVEQPLKRVRGNAAKQGQKNKSARMTSGTS